MSFVGDESDIILSHGCSIIWTNSSKLFWNSLNLIFNETNEINSSAIHFENSENVTISNASFFKFYWELNFFSRAILVVDSFIKFKSCKFENGYHSTGSSLYIKDSNVTFGGHNDFLNNTAYDSAGAMYGLRSQIQLSGKNIFMGKRFGLKTGLISDGTEIHVEFSSISLNCYFKFYNNHIIKNSYWYSGHGGGTIAASYSSLTMQGVFYFINNSNINGGAILLYNSECFIRGHAKFEGNEALSGGGAISATHSSLITNSNEFHLFNNSEYINSGSFSTSYFCNNLAGG